MSGNAHCKGRGIGIPQLPEVMSEAEDYLVNVTGWGRALCPSFRDRQPLVPRGAVPPTVSGVRVCSDIRPGQEFRPPVTE
jgi:hypothetical protein